MRFWLRCVRVRRTKDELKVAVVEHPADSDVAVSGLHVDYAGGVAVFDGAGLEMKVLG